MKIHPSPAQIAIDESIVNNVVSEQSAPLVRKYPCKKYHAAEVWEKNSKNGLWAINNNYLGKVGNSCRLQYCLLKNLVARDGKAKKVEYWVLIIDIQIRIYRLIVVFIYLLFKIEIVLILERVFGSTSNKTFHFKFAVHSN